MPVAILHLATEPRDLQKTWYIDRLTSSYQLCPQRMRASPTTLPAMKQTRQNCTLLVLLLTLAEGARSSEPPAATLSTPYVLSGILTHVWFSVVKSSIGINLYLL